MCRGCWKGEGSPTTLNQFSRACLPFLNYPGVEHGAGHIMFADWNLEDHHIKGCFEFLEREPMPDPVLNTVTAVLLMLFADMTMDERFATMALYEGFIE